MAALKVCLLSPGLPGTDPADLVGQQALRLAADHEVQVMIALTERRPVGAVELAFGGGVNVVAVEAAREERFDVVVATAWETTAHVFAVSAQRHAYLVDHLAHRRLGAWQAERVAAQLSYDLPLDFLAAGRWVADALAQLRPEARCIALVPGVDKATFNDLAAAGRDPSAANPRDGPLRVLVDDRRRPEGVAGPAAEAVGRMRAPHVLDELAPGDSGAARAARYAAADVLVRLDPVDGVLSSPLEAMHAGATVVVLPAGGQEELVRHRENGIVADPDDVRGTARWLDHLAADRALLGRLRTSALATARAWPSAADGAAQMAAALERLVGEPPPDDARWPVRLMADAIAGAAVLSNDHHTAAAYIRRLEADETYRAAVLVRERLEQPRLAPLRRAAGPLLRAARRRLAP
jgi:hypothetical protein